MVFPVLEAPGSMCCIARGLWALASPWKRSPSMSGFRLAEAMFAPLEVGAIVGAHSIRSTKENRGRFRVSVARFILFHAKTQPSSLSTSTSTAMPTPSSPSWSPSSSCGGNTRKVSAKVHPGTWIPLSCSKTASRSSEEGVTRNQILLPPASSGSATAVGAGEVALAPGRACSPESTASSGKESGRPPLPLRPPVGDVTAPSECCLECVAESSACMDPAGPGSGDPSGPISRLAGEPGERSCSCCCCCRWSVPSRGLALPDLRAAPDLGSSGLVGRCPGILSPKSASSGTSRRRKSKARSLANS
mmetsp:Transcript_25002/g.73074  ORF Transcript_25002/g.73074 Transcript_25002/m.73074 type:complete len:304 (-) Transcript_25002:1159-2070(-)